MMIVKGGGPFYGEAIGILILDTKAPLIPGNVGNASTYELPVRFKLLEGMPIDWWFDREGASPRRLEAFIEGARDLEREGVRAITTGCGYFSVFQKEASIALGVPLFTSPLLLVPMVSRMIGRTRKVGIIASGAEHLNALCLRSVGIDESIPLAIGGLEGQEEFVKVYNTGEKTSVDVSRLEQEVVEVAQGLVKRNPDTGAIVLECSDIPPCAAAIQESVRLPVFDFIDFINMVYLAVVKHGYEGFM
jgi:hypothetical protein